MRFAGMALDGGNYVNAAMNSGAAMDSILAENTPDYSGLSNMASAGQSQQRVAEMEALAMMQNAGINGLALAQQGKFGGESTLAQGESAASAIRSEGLNNMIKGIGGGLINGIGSFKTKDYGNIDTYGGNKYADAFTPGGSLSRSQQGW